MHKLNVKTEPAESIHNSSEKIHFEDMHLRVGQKMYLALSNASFGKPSNPYATSMIGYIQNNTLMVTMPLSGQLIGGPFVEGDQVHVRLANGKNAYKFSVFIDKVIKTPFKYLHLSFPKNIQGQSIRKSRRIKCDYQATIAEDSISANIVDLSIYGAGINSTLPLGTLNSVVTLSFTILVHDKEIPLLIKAIIKSTKQNYKNDQKLISSGVEFIEINPDQEFTLNHLIYQEIVEHPEKAI
ncbi:flagellar brake protein [Nitrosomonas ureae]|uniref:PilZ domain-containing protein n=1 Tax=Nitrosomonas ureae TaxID=44577 RepID=A0A1H5UML5_9PROT|nr:flagellar brake protein [Nitrosomonas ureae]SEF76292.1 PilZ domain-containing protein [Nitrosomonas ureae]